MPEREKQARSAARSYGSHLATSSATFKPFAQAITLLPAGIALRGFIDLRYTAINSVPDNVRDPLNLIEAKSGLYQPTWWRARDLALPSLRATPVAPLHAIGKRR